jgi:hypothetical protein
VTLVVEAPQAYEPERRYALEVVLGDRLGLDWRLQAGDRQDVRLTLDGEDGAVVAPDVLFATPQAQWLTDACLPRLPLRRMGDVALLYGVDRPELVRADGDTTTLAVDVLGGAFFMLTRLEEHVVATRDGYGRFPADASVVHREGLLVTPIVDVYVDLLWEALSGRWPRLRRRRDEYRVKLTHDVDDPLARLGRRPRDLVRQLGGDVLVRRDPALPPRRMASWLAGARGNRRLDPHNTFDWLMDLSERHGVASAFYFMVADGTPGAEDPPYPIDHPWIVALMQRIHRRGHEIGFHPTDIDPDRTVRGFHRLRAVAEGAGVQQAQWGGRQHYLRWQNPSTWRTWERAGLDYDTTLTYPDHVGFRTGTCHEYGVFDLVERRSLRLRERPFQVMDRTVFEYMGLGPQAAHDAVAQVAAQCRGHDGTLGLLWHNNMVMTAAQKRGYERIVQTAVGSG